MSNDQTKDSKESNQYVDTADTLAPELSTQDYTPDTLTQDAALPQSSTTMSWHGLINQELGGCLIQEILGRGGMGVVFKAHHLSLDIPVAIKCLPPQQHKMNQDSQERFSREARAAARLKHENIVSVYNAGADNGLHYIVMELIEGESLEQKIRRKGRLPVDEALRYTLDICEALAYAEKQSLVHRDLKPSNILINHDGQAKLADLGLVKWETEQEQEALTMQGVAMGTPHYMAPEQTLDANAVDHRADLYALGCTLYHMLSGKTPFAHTNVHKLMHQHIQAERPILSQVQPEISQEISDLVYILMSKDPVQRYQTASLVITHILDIFEHSLVSNYPMILPNNYRSNYQHYERFALQTARKKLNYLTWGLIVVCLSALALILYLWKRNSYTQNTIKEMQESTAHQSVAIPFPNPKNAYEHYENGTFHSAQLSWLKASQSYKQAFIEGYHYIDVLDKMIGSLESLNSENMIVNTLKELKLLFPNKPMIPYMLANRKTPIDRLKDHREIIKNFDDFIPSYIAIAHLIDSPYVSDTIHILDAYHEIVTMINKVYEFQLKDLKVIDKYYLKHSSKIREKEKFNHIYSRYANIKKLMIDPLLVIYNMGSNDKTCTLTVVANGQLYHSFKKIKFNKFEGNTSITEDNILSINKGLYEKVGSISLQVDCLSKGNIVVEVTDTNDHSKEFVLAIDIVDEHTKICMNAFSFKTWYKQQVFNITALDIKVINQLNLTIPFLIFYGHIMRHIDLIVLDDKNNMIKMIDVDLKESKISFTIDYPPALKNKVETFVLKINIELLNHQKLSKTVELSKILYKAK